MSDEEKPEEKLEEKSEEKPKRQMSEDALPLISEQWRDTKWCDSFDSLTASTPSGESTTVAYTTSHFGVAVPRSGLTLSLSRASTPATACSTVTEVTQGGNVSGMAATISAGGVAGQAVLASIYACPFIDKALRIEEVPGAELAIVYNQGGNQLFYMAAASVSVRAPEHCLC
eukprot:gene1519-6670_t